LVLHAKLYINRRPKLKRITLATIGLFRPLAKYFIKGKMPTPSSQMAHPAHSELPANARLIYSQLIKEIDNVKKADQ
jgi:hypothetical protein